MIQLKSSIQLQKVLLLGHLLLKDAFFQFVIRHSGDILPLIYLMPQKLVFFSPPITSFNIEANDKWRHSR